MAVKINNEALDKILQAGGYEFYQELVEIYDTNTKEQISEMQRLLSDARFKECGKVAHTLKSGSAYMGVDALSSLAAEIELHTLQDGAISLEFLTECLSEIQLIFAESLLQLRSIKMSA